MSGSCVTEVRRYPVKSMMGEVLAQSEVTEQGLVGDRAWAVRDEERGGIRGGKKIPELMTLAARYDEGVERAPMMTAPDGSEQRAGVDGTNAWLSDKLSHPVTLWPLIPADQLDHYRRGAPDSEDFEQELRAVFGRLPEEPLPDLALFAEVIEFESPPGTYFDAFPILIMSQQSLRTMAARAPDSQFDVRRFRPNIVVDFGEYAGNFPELAWVGKTLRIGSAEFEVVGACPRCSMTTHGFDDLPRDTDVMRVLVNEAQGDLGIYARVSKAGVISQDDVVEVLG